MSENDSATDPRQTHQVPKLVAEFHVPLGVRHLGALADALQLVIGEVLYFQGGGLRVVSYGEPYPPENER